MHFTSIFGASLLAAAAQASLVSIKVPSAVRKGESFPAHIHVQSGQSSGEVAYIFGQLPHEPANKDNEMGSILSVVSAKSLPLGESTVSIPGIVFPLQDTEATLKVRVVTYQGVGGLIDHFNCQATVKAADHASSDLVTLDCKR